MLYLIVGLVIALLIMVIAVSIYKSSYFKSEKFRSLSAQSDDIVERRQELKKITDRFVNSTRVDFSPTAAQQMEMQSHRTGAIDQNKTLPTYTYFCTSEIFKEVRDNPCKILRDYCGFTSNPGVLGRIDLMQKDAEKIQKLHHELVKHHEEQVCEVDSKLPLLIKLLAKKKAMFLLGLDVMPNMPTQIFPSYSFKDMSNSSKLETVTLSPDMIRKLSTYLEEHPTERRSSLNFKKD